LIAIYSDPEQTLLPKLS